MDAINHIDWDRVGEAIQGIEDLESWDYEKAAELVVLAANRYLEEDLAGGLVSINGWEQKIRRKVESYDGLNPQGVSGFLDLNLSFESYPVLVDWKKTGDIGPKWRQKVRASHQHGIYAGILFPGETVVFQYRGIHSSGKKFRTVELTVTPEEAQQALRHATQTVRLMRLMDNDGPPWFRNVQNCRAFGRLCPEFKTCVLEPDHPTHRPDWLVPRWISPSRVNAFWQCPERQRRGIIARDLGQADPDDNEFGRFGNALHAGMAEVYKQAKEIWDL